MKKLLPVIIIAVIGAGLFAYYMYNKPHVETKDAEAEVIITPAELMKAYENDEAKADSLYLDKIIEITGVVKKINDSHQGSSLSLDTGNEMTSIICEFENADALKNIQTESTVTIKGILSGKLMDIVLNRCSIK